MAGAAGGERTPSVFLAEQAGYEDLQSALTAGAEVVLVIVGGCPMLMDPSVVDGCSAIVAAWLPGSRGIGVADAHSGDVDFTGKLPHEWPAEFARIPVNVDRQPDELGQDADGTEVLHPYGFGLTYR
ncbi:MAG: glycoside hydrolase family 3 C-terminal domain-containing protein [Polyangiaceae bacterium]|nr:glycoside hydrolase family 3 C-terminal domain-containing protein [Polyangiaceae bacterium]